MKNKKLVTENVLGSRMSLDLQKRGIFRELFVNNIREPLITDVFKNSVKQGDIIVDIGANIGYYALLGARLTGERGVVYAIEPVEYNLNFLRKNIVLNCYKNVKVFKCAIGEKDSTKRIFLTEKNNWCSLRKPEKAKVLGERFVKVLSLDSFLKGKKEPDVIRMDVEGYEKNIVKGMRGLLKSNKPLKIFIELHSFLLEKQGLEILKDLIEHNFKIKVFLQDSVPIITKESRFTKSLFNFMARKIFGPAEFKLFEPSIGDLLHRKSILKEGVFQVLLTRE